MLNIDPKRRITAKAALQHSWFAQIQKIQQKEIDANQTNDLLNTLKSFKVSMNSVASYLI